MAWGRRAREGTPPCRSAAPRHSPTLLSRPCLASSFSCWSCVSLRGCVPAGSSPGRRRNCGHATPLPAKPKPPAPAWLERSRTQDITPPRRVDPWATPRQRCLRTPLHTDPGQGHPGPVLVPIGASVLSPTSPGPQRQPGPLLMPEHLLGAGAGARAASPPTASTPGLVVGLRPAVEVAGSLGRPCRVALGAPRPGPAGLPGAAPTGDGGGQGAGGDGCRPQGGQPFTRRDPRLAGLLWPLDRLSLAVLRQLRCPQPRRGAQRLV